VRSGVNGCRITLIDQQTFELFETYEESSKLSDAVCKSKEAFIKTTFLDPLLKLNESELNAMVVKEHQKNQTLEHKITAMLSKAGSLYTRICNAHKPAFVFSKACQQYENDGKIVFYCCITVKHSNEELFERFSTIDQNASMSRAQCFLEFVQYTKLDKCSVVSDQSIIFP
jgi:hypothetical protein